MTPTSRPLTAVAKIGKQAPYSISTVIQRANQSSYAEYLMSNIIALKQLPETLALLHWGYMKSRESKLLNCFLIAVGKVPSKMKIVRNSSPNFINYSNTEQIKPATAFYNISSMPVTSSFTYCIKPWKILSLIISCIIHRIVCNTLWINYLDNKMTASAINVVGLKW